MDNQTEKLTLPHGVQWISRIFFGIAFLILLFYLIVYVAYANNLMQFPFDYDQGEGFELVDTLMFSQGMWPYQEVEGYPFYSSNYPPLFHVMAVPFAWAFGPGYWYGRLLGFLGTLISASAIGYAVYREGKRYDYTQGALFIGVLSGLAFLASNIIYHIGPLLRQHMTMVMFETLAIVILSYSGEIENQRKRRLTIALGLLLIIAAGYTKQLAAFTAIAVFAWMFLRNPRWSISWGILFALVGGGIFVWMNWATNGAWWEQAILANANQTRFPQIEGLYRLWFSLHGFLIIPAVLMVIYETYFSRFSLYSIWFVVALLLGGISSGTWGGGDSYFATAISAMSILSGIFVLRTINSAWEFEENYLSKLFITPLKRVAPVLAIVGVLIMPLLYIGYGRAVLHMPTTGTGFEQIAEVLDLEPNALNGFYDSAGRIAGGYADIGHFTTQADIDAGYQIVEIIQSSEKPVLSEEAGFNLVAGREVITNPTQLLNVWLRGLYDGSELIDMIANQEFGAIILRAQFYPEPVLIAIDTHYEVSETISMNGFDYIIKRPKDSSSE